MKLWSEKMPEITCILLNVFRLVLYPSMWSILDYTPCELEKNVHSGFLFVFGYNILDKINCLLDFGLPSGSAVKILPAMQETPV